MKRFLIWSRDNPWFAIGLLLVITGLAATRLSRVRVDSSTDGMMIEGDPARAKYRESVRDFGSDNVTIVYFKDKNIFTREKLQALEKAIQSFQDLSGVQRVDSLFNATHFKGKDGVLSTNPFLDPIPDTQAEIDRIKADAMSNPLIYRQSVSKDGDAIAVLVTAEDMTEESIRYLGLAKEMESVIESVRGNFDDVFQAGIPRFRYLIDKNIHSDQATIIPIAAVLLLIFLLFLLRSVNAAVLPLITGGIAILWTLAFMVLTDIPVNVLTAIVPALVLVIGSAEIMHIIDSYFEGLEHSANDRKAAIAKVIRHTTLAIIMTSATTVLGFVSTAINQITLLKQFGVVSAFGLTANFVVTLLVYPIYLRFLGNKVSPFSKKEKESPVFSQVYDRICETAVSIMKNRKKEVLIGAVAVCVVAFVGMLQIRLDNNFVNYFKPNSEIRQRTGVIAKELSGANSLSIMIEGAEGAFKKSDALTRLFRVQERIAETGLVGSSTSIASYLALIHREMNDGKSDFYRIPEKDALIPQYLLLIQGTDRERLLTSDYKKANITVRHSVSSSYELKIALAKLRAMLAQELGDGFKFDVLGEEVIMSEAADSMAGGQAQSLGFLFLVMFIGMSILFLNVKAGFLSLIPTAVPVLLLYGIMGWFGIPLNTGTALVADIAIGIAVDDTIHLMVQYNQEMKKDNDQYRAIEAALRGEIRPVFATATALSMGFLVLAASNFMPTMHFGVLSFIVMIIGLLSDLVFTPILCQMTRLVTLWDMIGLKLRKESIERSVLFDGMKMREMKKVVLLGNTREYQEGDVIIHQGERERRMYLVLDGAVEVRVRRQAGAPKMVDRFQEGQVIGEIGLVSEVERTADVVCVKPTRVLIVDWPSLVSLRRYHPVIASKLFLNIARILGVRLAKEDEAMGRADQFA